MSHISIICSYADGQPDWFYFLVNIIFFSFFFFFKERTPLFIVDFKIRNISNYRANKNGEIKIGVLQRRTTTGFVHCIY